MSDAIATVRIGQPFSDRVRVSGTWCTRLAPYDGAGFHVVLEGACWLLPDGGTPVRLGVGDAVLLPHGTGHVIADSPAGPAAVAGAVPFEEWAEARKRRGSTPPPGPSADDPRSSRGGVEMLCGKYRLDRSRPHPLMAELPHLVHLPNRVGGNPELRAAIELLGSELTAQRPGHGIAVPSLVDLLLVYMVRSWVTQDSSAAWSAVLGDPVTAAAVRALHADPAAPWTNDRLAVEAGVSRPTLARRFASLVGRPPMAYLTWWRLTLAATLLRDTQESLAVIARRVGYGTPYALSHAFSREFGTTPGRYRTRNAARPHERADR